MKLKSNTVQVKGSSTQKILAIQGVTSENWLVCDDTQPDDIGLHMSEGTFFFRCGSNNVSACFLFILVGVGIFCNCLTTTEHTTCINAYHGW